MRLTILPLRFPIGNCTTLLPSVPNGVAPTPKTQAPQRPIGILCGILCRLVGPDPAHFLFARRDLSKMPLNESLKNIVDFSKANGLVTAIAQDAETGEILMVANMNEESLAKTIELGEAVYWSRSRQKLWHKGEESGNVQKVKALYLDCDGDAVLMKVEQIGDAACHTGKRSCFFRKVEDDGTIADVGIQVFDPSEVYKK